MARRPRRKTLDDTEATLAKFRALPGAKPLRAAAMFYAARREQYTVGHVLTDDAEENLYRQALAFAVEAAAKK